ncbi:MAG: TetR family transcriptional regulator [Eggerthellaceae bacterium]|nr:TetR family transcriptional regulator [Eggerthellaceae bacterium]
MALNQSTDDNVSSAEAPTRKTRAARDPEGRKRAIAQAAADVIVHEGVGKVTHRRVAEAAGVPLGSTTAYFKDIADLKQAGLNLLSEQMATYDAEAFALAASEKPQPENLARQINEYLSDKERVASDAAFYATALGDPDLRQLAVRALNSFVAAFAPHVSEPRARVLLALIDGALIDAALYDKPVDPDVVQELLEVLLKE